MRKIFLNAVYLLVFSSACLCQDSVQTNTIITGNSLRQPADVHPKLYTVKAKVEIPLVIAGGGVTLYNFSRISKKTSSDPAYIQTLSKNNVNWFDRWGVRRYNENNDNISYIPFFVSMPSPFILFALDKKMRKDFFKLSFLYAEALTITGVLYSAGAGYTNRLRPMVYSSETPMEKRLASEQKKSFFAGHVALVATSTFFMARVIADYHPESHYKWLYYSIAGAATATTAYFRQAAGEHFPSDILLGAVVGTLSGLLTPSLHKNKLFNSQRLSILPYGGINNGIAVLYHL